MSRIQRNQQGRSTWRAGTVTGWHQCRVSWHEACMTVVLGRTATSCKPARRERGRYGKFSFLSPSSSLRTSLPPRLVQSHEKPEGKHRDAVWASIHGAGEQEWNSDRERYTDHLQHGSQVGCFLSYCPRKTKHSWHRIHLPVIALHLKNHTCSVRRKAVYAPRKTLWEKYHFSSSYNFVSPTLSTIYLNTIIYWLSSLTQLYKDVHKMSLFASSWD